MKTGSEYIYASVSIICWGFSATISKLLLENLDPYCTFAYACAFAGLVLLPWCGFKGKLKAIREYSPSTLLRMLGIGFLGILVYNICLLLGISRLPAQEAFVINYLWPAMIILFGCIILREKLTLGKAAAIILSFVGIIVVTAGGGKSASVSGDIRGILCCVTAAVSYGLYSVLNKRESYDKDLSVMLTYAASAVIGFILAAAMGRSVSPLSPSAGGPCCVRRLLRRGRLCDLAAGH
ncbi:MAG: DMT family transporter [Oscillospiraceae bacterium]|nr:DMT family transporter [Oscillospiraceae bacterium]